MENKLFYFSFTNNLEGKLVTDALVLMLQKKSGRGVLSPVILS